MCNHTAKLVVAITCYVAPSPAVCLCVAWVKLLDIVDCTIQDFCMFDSLFKSIVCAPVQSVLLVIIDSVDWSLDCGANWCQIS